MTKKNGLLIFFLLLILTGGFTVSWLFLHLNHRINNSLEKGWHRPLVEYYTASEKIILGTTLSPKDWKKKLQQRYYIPLPHTDHLRPGYFLYRKDKTCGKKERAIQKSFQNEFSKINIEKSNAKEHLNEEGIEHSLSWQDSNTGALFCVGFNNNKIVSLQKNHKEVELITLKPFIFAQYENGEPILKQFTPLNEFPFYCLQSVLTAEDHQFITHEGISLKAIIRAMGRNLRAGRLLEGGSTITQQLIKNIFFNQKKSFWRKFQEQIMALLLETKLSKDEILTAYLNIVYMGQSGLFRIHGFSSAARYYFSKPLSRLDLSECALLASLIKSPGRYKPSANNKSLLQRRNHILNKLHEKRIINAEELNISRSQAIRVNIQKQTPPIYFTDTVYKKIKELNLPWKKGLKVFTTLYPDFQDKADQSLKEGLKWLEKNRLKKELNPKGFRGSHIQRNQTREEIQKEAKTTTKIKTHSLQAALVNVDVATGAVRAILGGRNFKVSQFNRAIQAKRQVGSLVKPAVVLAALTENPNLNPLSAVEDRKFTHKYNGSRAWSPKNYKNKYKGDVPLYQVLTFSLNAGAASLGLKTGLKPLIQIIKALVGPSTPVIPPHPSLVLGTLEISPWMVAQMFLTIANMGTYKKQHIIKKVTDLKDTILYEYKDKTKPVIDKTKAAVLVGMLKEVTKSGTARWLKNFAVPAAGKTGTTNDEKDAWFVGFTPESLTVIWLGFDNNTPHYLSGAEGALPLWESFMKKILPYLSSKSFDWPEGVVHQTIQIQKKDSKKDFPIKNKNPKEGEEVQLVFERESPR
ncbi:MAG: transglycosylase domain-containing protein [Bdellovibrionales bacterium]|nr:transglycosylase domain-containing protein [Bdellovibrionales bacterium]